MEERKWSFDVYEVDCSANYELCKSRAPFIQSYPYVIIYNMEGKMEAKIKGYYPYEVMKQAFINIENMQNKAVDQQESVPTTS